MKNRNLNHKDDWQTPPEFVEKLEATYGKFDHDPCPLHGIDRRLDGLAGDWGQNNFVNPPYSRMLKESFVRKGVEQMLKGKRSVFLLPVSTSTKLFHDVILPNASSIEFVKGRISFVGVNTHGVTVGAGSSPMHDSMVVLFDPDPSVTTLMFGSIKISKSI